MRTYTAADGERHWICGHWNGSPLEIGVGGHLFAVPEDEVTHHHPYSEYYVVLEGSGVVEVEGKQVPLEAGSVVMVEAGERHSVVEVSPEGVKWIVIKERSEPGGKLL